jgi:preprotein translocase subunit SecE
MARATDGAAGSALTKPARIPQAKPAQERRSFRLWNVTVQFLQDVRAEMKRVVWPERKMVIASSLVVVFVMAVTSLYLATVDLLLARIFQQAIFKF